MPKFQLKMISISRMFLSIKHFRFCFYIFLDKFSCFYTLQFLLLTCLRKDFISGQNGNELAFSEFWCCHYLEVKDSREKELLSSGNLYCMMWPFWIWYSLHQSVNKIGFGFAEAKEMSDWPWKCRTWNPGQNDLGHLWQIPKNKINK